MPQIPFPTGFLGSENLPRTRRDLINCFNNGQNEILTRPGLEQLNTTDGVARGQFVWNDALYQVVSEDLIKITDTDTGAFSTIGTIAGSTVVETDVGFNEAVIVVKGGAIYTLDDVDALVDISGNANFVPCVDVAFINGRFVYIPSDGDPAFFSDVGDAGSVQAASFFDAEELPDKNNSVFNIKNTLYIGGTDSFELFKNVATSIVFQRISGARIQNGFIGGLIEYKDTFVFIGREKDQDFGIYAIGQGNAPKLSNSAIDLALSTYSNAELANAVGARYKWRGYDIATFTLARDSWGFFNGEWHNMETHSDGIDGPFGGGFITQLDGTYYTAFSDKIGRLAKINTDYGERITRIINTGFQQEDNRFFTAQSIELGISQGFNTADGSVALFLSRDNVLYGQPMYKDLGAIGNYADKLKWNPPGGMGSYNGFMGVKIYTTEDIIFNANQMFANFR